MLLSMSNKNCSEVCISDAGRASYVTDSRGRDRDRADNPELKAEFRQTKIAYWNARNGVFRDVTAQAGAPLAEWRVVWRPGDLDGDGGLEIVVVNMNAPPMVLKNVAPKGELGCSPQGVALLKFSGARLGSISVSPTSRPPTTTLSACKDRSMTRERSNPMPRAWSFLARVA